jgi:hypothetical protein
MNHFGAAAATALAPTPTSAADVKGTPPGTVMTKEYITMVGRLAYVWGWPMVNQINRRAAFSKEADRK